METLNKFLAENGFSNATGVAGLTNREINVFYSSRKEQHIVMVSGKAILASKDEAEIIAAVTAELVKANAAQSQELDSFSALAKEIAKNETIAAYYNSESKQGKDIMIRDALAAAKAKLPSHITFSQFKTMIEAAM